MYSSWSKYTFELYLVSVFNPIPNNDIWLENKYQLSVKNIIWLNRIINYSVTTLVNTEYIHSNRLMHSLL